MTADGLHRVSYEQLAAAGVDVAALSPARLGLVNRGQAVPIRLSAARGFGPGDYIEFIGAAATGLYTRTSVYELVDDRSRALRVDTDGSKPRGLGEPILPGVHDGGAGPGL